jgi:hypothetical protein
MPPIANFSERDVIVHELRRAAGRFLIRRIRLAVGLHQTIDPLTGEGHLIHSLAVFFIAVLAERAVGVDEVSDADVPSNVALSGVIEDCDFVPV